MNVEGTKSNNIIHRMCRHCSFVLFSVLCKILKIYLPPVFQSVGLEGNSRYITEKLLRQPCNALKLQLSHLPHEK